MSDKIDLGYIAGLIKGLQEEVRKSNEESKLFREQLEQVKIRVRDLENSQNAAENRIKLHNMEIKRLNNAYRRNNLIIYNFEEVPNETMLDLMGRIVELFSLKMDVSIQLDNIDYAQRLGKIENKGNRPVLLKLHSFWQKLLLFKASKKLKGTNIIITNDYPEEVRVTRRLLMPFLREARQNNCTAYIRYDKIIINQRRFSLEDCMNGAHKTIVNRPVSQIDNNEEEEEEAATNIHERENKKEVKENTKKADKKKDQPVETWLTVNDIKLPNYLKEYKMFNSKAVRDKTRGRASGGLMILTQNCINNVEVIDINELHIFVQFSLKNEVFILGNIYWPPLADIDVCTEILDEQLFNIETNLPSGSHIIITADFNSRIGNLNCLENSLFDGFSLNGKRYVLDEKITHRGRVLIDVMESHDMFICNGRSVSDSPANYTYLSSNGNSTIDHVWLDTSSLNIVNDFQIINLTELSTHLFCKLSLNFNINNKVSKEMIHGTKEYIKWDINKLNSFQTNLNSNNIYFNSSNVNSLHENLLAAIYK
ncbi:hypothetical protein O3M35_011628 [Rhynocoris fuscipes]|uniref:Endonuclease/exonuclease/phosphatase domain-containing protein n=1 Tax=Rhynocoris fuscipes TaxID=488301 RepID=A0AAW1CWY5_9HEMI